MQVFHQISDLQSHLQAARKAAKNIALVPTMGALHEGHLSLIARASAENEVVVCSIFVNPIQFNNAQDLAHYPRNLAEDCLLLEAYPKVIVFAPNVEEMYPSEPQTQLHFGAVEEVLEGAFRPGHFSGVGVVVSRLFNIVAPDKAYFGQKDLQQCLVIKQMVRDLAFNLEVVICPTQREANGLALSSRNRRLSDTEREEATLLYQSLQKATEMLNNGKMPETIQNQISQDFAQSPLELEYFSLADGENLRPLSQIERPQKVAICVAAYLGEVRLIDNLLVYLEK